jgi:G3E family GTPase
MENGNIERVPATILTGFLGSGKTTVLNSLLKLPDLKDTAVIVNEFGEVGIDHLIIEQAFENAVLLKNGCICCTVRGDIADTLATLWRQAQAGSIPRFSRIAIETTGLADPAPVAHTLVDDATGDYACRLDGIVTTADAVHILDQLQQQEEARKQVALADRILLTKTDMIRPEQQTEIMQALRRLNPHAPMRVVPHGVVQAEDVFGLSPDQAAAAAHLRRWLMTPEDNAAHHHHHGHGPSRHGARIGSVVLTATAPVNLAALQTWLDSLLSLRGQDILRLKGIVRLQGEDRPLLLQGVHHVLHKPVWLEEKPGYPAQTEIVLITRDMSPAGIRESFATCMALK